MLLSKFKIILHTLLVVILTLGFSISLQSLLAAWQAPTANPPDGNVSGPVYTSGRNMQAISGDITLSNGKLLTAGNIITAGTSTADKAFCLGTTNPSCITNWSNAGKTYTAGSGLNLTNNTFSLDTTNLTTGCGDATTGKVWWNGTKLVCATDQTGSGGGSGGLTGAGTANYIAKWTGGTSLGNSTIFETGGNVGIGTTNPVYKLDVNGNIRATQFCIGTNCISSWTSGGGTESDTFQTVTQRGATTNVPVLDFLQTTNNHMYFNSNKGFQIKIDNDNNDANASFQINNGNNQTVFSVDENGNLVGLFSVPWVKLSGFPTACPSGQYVTGIGQTLTCSTPSGSGSYTAGSGLNLTNNTFSLDTTNLTTGCGDATTGKVWWNGTKLVCATDQTGSGGGSGGLTGAGTANYIAKWTGGTSLGNSTIFETGGNVGIGTTNPVTSLDIRNNTNAPVNWGTQNQIVGFLGYNNNDALIGAHGLSNGNLRLRAGGQDILQVMKDNYIKVGFLNIFGRSSYSDISVPAVGSDGTNIGVKISNNGAFYVLDQNNMFNPKVFAKDFCTDSGKCLSTTGGGSGGITEIYAGTGIQITQSGTTRTISVVNTGGSLNIQVVSSIGDTYAWASNVVRDIFCPSGYVRTGCSGGAQEFLSTEPYPAKKPSIIRPNGSNGCSVIGNGSGYYEVYAYCLKLN